MADWENRHDICFSGGAIGADYYWSWKAEKVGHKVVAYSFDGHQFAGPIHWKRVIHADNLVAVLKHVKFAGIKMRREGALSANWYTRSLFCRNYYQVKDAERVYAVGMINQSTGYVEGGTGWACQMFIDRFPGDTPVPIYIYELIEKWWYTWDGRAWVACKTIPPRPEGHYAGIGTRKFSDWGRKAIDDLFAQ
jgi:hypothetical protein